MGDWDDSWGELAAALGAPHEAAWRELVRRYGENGRYYHTLTHVRNVLATIERLTPAPSPALRLAAWFHDIVYDPQRQDNEAASAAVARRILQQWRQPPALIEQVEAMILATRAHAAAAGETAVLLDADLAVLGAPWPEYQAYAQAIRLEYAFAPDDAYRAGRAAVLRRFLQRPFIYQTPQMHAARETAARANLRREITQLLNYQ